MFGAQLGPYRMPHVEKHLAERVRVRAVFREHLIFNEAIESVGIEQVTQHTRLRSADPAERAFWLDSVEDAVVDEIVRSPECVGGKKFNGRALSYCWQRSKPRPRLIAVL